MHAGWRFWLMLIRDAFGALVLAMLLCGLTLLIWILFGPQFGPGD